MNEEELKNIDDIQNCEITYDIIKMIKQWIIFLEYEAGEYLTDYPQGRFQAKILRRIFKLEEWMG